MKVHERLDQELNRQGKTQASLAEAVGVSSATVSQWRSGTKTPSATNMIKVAKFLGVQASWLSYGELGTTPRSVDPQQRAAYVEECSWYYRPAPQDAGRELGNAAGFAFHGGVATLARETSQNILDEAEAGQPTVEARYTLIELTGARLDAFLDTLQVENLRPHLEAAADSRQKVAAVIRRGLTALDDDRKLILLRVEDYGAKGLVGPEYDEGNYMAVVRNILDSFKGDNAGGSYGLGKSVMWACSQFGLVLINSTLSVAQDGNREGRFIARLELPWHRLPKPDGTGFDAFAGPAWFGEKDVERGGVTRSYWANEALAADTYLAREDDRSGTSFLIVGAYDPDDRIQTIEEMHDELVGALAKSFWPAMVGRAGDEPGMMTALVRSERNGVTIKSDLVDPYSYSAAKARMLQMHRDDLTVDALEQPGDVVRRQLTLEVPRRLGDGSQASQQHDAVLLVTEADEDETNTNRVAYLRGSHMVIREEPVPGLAMGSRSFHAVVLAGLAAGDDPADKAAERFLRAAEPPEHDNWEVTPDVSSSYARGYGKALNDFKVEVRRAIREIVGRPSRDLSDGPDALKELLRITPQTIDSTKRPRVKSAIGKPDELGRWSLDIRVSLPAREAPWSFSPVLRFGTESGAAIPVEWEELIAESKCAVHEEVVTAEPHAREVRFRGFSRIDSHPVDASLATALVDVRVYKESAR